MIKSYMGKFLYQYIMHEMFPGRIFDWTVETGDLIARVMVMVMVLML